MSAEKSDWLDLALKNHPVADEGFYDRVIAVGRAQQRNRWLLRLLVAVLVVGFVAAFGAFVVLQAAQGRGWGAADETDRWFHDERAAFHSELARLDAVPALARRTGRDAAVVLDRVGGELATPGSPLARCVFDLDALGPGAAGSRERFVAVDDRCDTSFIVGLAGYDDWRRVRDVDVDTSDLGRASGALARSHLREARRSGPAAYAAAGDDVAALGRLLWGHTPFARATFYALIEETRDAAAAGEHGGFVPPLTVRDVDIATAVWAASVGFASVAATADDFAAVDQSRSVLSCGARADPFADLVLQERFFADAKSAGLSRDGCSPRAVGLGTWLLFDSKPTRWARVRAALLELPVLRSFAADLVRPVFFRPSIVKQTQKAITP